MRLGVRFGVLFVGWIFLLSSQVSLAADEIPECLAYGRPLSVNNDQVLHWKRTTGNQFRERGNIRGVVVEVLPDRRTHDHFTIKIGKRDYDTVEVIYNTDFGQIPDPQIGMVVQACGDYITATAQSGPYPPSPAGAIIHWLHMNPRGRGHDPGFLVMDGVLYGQEADRAPPRRRDFELEAFFQAFSE
jgi:hypothetical protein